MWSGPRNISTAMLRAWGNRPDTWVTDEPLYAHYLHRTGLPHPGAAEIIAAYDPDWRRVAEWLTGPVPEGRRLWYQKHMAHHLLSNIERDWLQALTHCFLIREPREMVTSLMKIIPEPTLEDTGLPQQVALFEWERERTGSLPPVLDSRDVLNDPAGTMRRLCEVLEVPFTEAMLSWPAGPRATDGVWAKYWYDAVERSTGFQPYAPKPEPVPDSLLDLEARCNDLYEQLYAHRLGPETPPQ
ncbi:MAG: hypothetical protein K0Q72_3595 [Armatimonadetes bacterium]|nr:hypothetical protein [Armatimonadota bacterium]